MKLRTFWKWSAFETIFTFCPQCNVLTGIHMKVEVVSRQRLQGRTDLTPVEDSPPARGTIYTPTGREGSRLAWENR